MIGIIAEFDLIEGKMDEFLEEVAPLVDASVKEEGCIKYELHKALDSDTCFCMVEEWKDQDAIDRHNASAHLVSIGPRLKALQKDGIKVTLFEKVM